MALDHKPNNVIAPLFLPLLYLMDNASIHGEVRGKYLTHFMEFQTKGGQTINSFLLDDDEDLDGDLCKAM